MKKMFNKKFFLILGSAITLLIVLSVAMIFLTKENVKTFAREGYIIASGNKEENVKYYFEEGTSYKKNISSQLVFTDKSGEKVTVDTDNFMHYTDGGIKFLKNGVIMDLNNINNTTVPYYNITDKSVLEYTKKSYYIETIDKTLAFNNIAGRISENKYIFAGINVKLQLAGNENLIEGDYFELTFIEDGIIKVENSDVSYQTTAENSYILVDDNIKIDLGNKKIYFDGEEKMSLSQMTIDGNENIEIVPEEDEGSGSGTGTGDGTGDNTPNDEQNPNNQGGTGTETPGQDAPGNETTPPEDGEDDNQEQNPDNPETPEGGNGQGGTGTGSGSGITSKSVWIELEKAEVTATTLNASFIVEDPYNVIKNDLVANIINADTGIKLEPIPLTEFESKIHLNMAKLVPDTNYIISITEETGINKETQYYQRMFKTDSLGLTLEKKYATQESLVFEVTFREDSKVKSVTLTLQDKNKNVVGEPQIKTPDNNIAYFVEPKLEPNTEYSVILDNVIMDNLDYNDSYSKYKTAKTLKNTPYLEGLFTSVDDETSTFTIGVNRVLDEHESITKYYYYIYNADEITPENEDTIKPIKIIDGEKNKKIDIKIDNQTIFPKTNYKFKIVAEYYDNEKIGEFETEFSEHFILSGKPTIDFVKDEENTSFNKISGTIMLKDDSCTVPMDKRSCSSIRNHANNFILEYKIINETEKVEKSITFEPKTLESRIEIDNLLANTEYVFNLYGDVDLLDGKGLRKKYLIGTFRASTTSIDILTVEDWIQNESTRTDVINVSAKITSSGENKNLGDSLKNIKFNLYAGDVISQLKAGVTVTPLKTADLYVTDELKEVYYENYFTINSLDTFGIKDRIEVTEEPVIDPETGEQVIDPETGEPVTTTKETVTKAIDVLKEMTDGKIQNYYTIEITDIYDEGFQNEIQIENNYFAFNTPPIFILEDQLAMPSIVADPVENIDLQGNDELKDLLKLKYNSNLSDSSIVAFKFNTIVNAPSISDWMNKIASYFPGSDPIKELIYYACDADNNSDCMPETAVETAVVDLMKTSDFASTMLVKKGTSFNSDDTELTRGHNYIFKLKFHIDTNNDGTPDTYYPNSEVTSSKIKVEKTNPVYQAFILNTTGNKITYRIELFDFDSALYENSIYYTINDELKNVLNKKPSTEEDTGDENPDGEDSEETTPDDNPEEVPEETPTEKIEPIEGVIDLNNCSNKYDTTDGRNESVCTFELDSLSNNSVYNISLKKALIKKKTSVTKTKIGEYIFDGEYVYDQNTITYSLVTDENDNRLRIKINEDDTNGRYINRISTYEVVLSAEGLDDYTLVYTSDKINTCGTEDNTYKCIIVDYANIAKFKTKDIKVKVSAYYDSGIINNDYESNTLKTLNNIGYILQQNNDYNASFTSAKYLHFDKDGKPSATTSPRGIYAYGETTKYKISLIRKTSLTNLAFADEEEQQKIDKSLTYTADKIGIPPAIGETKIPINTKLLSTVGLGSTNDTFKFNSIIPKVKVDFTNKVDGTTIKVTPTGLDEDILKNEFKSEDGSYYYYINIYKDQEKTQIVEENIKLKIDLKTGYSEVTLTKYMPDTTYYMDISAYLLKEKEYKKTLLFNASVTNDYVATTHSFSTLAPARIFYGSSLPEATYASTSNKDAGVYLNRTMTLNLKARKNIGAYTVRFELYDINNKLVLTETVTPDTTADKSSDISKVIKDITPTLDEINNNGKDGYVFGEGYYTLKVYTLTDVFVSDEAPEGKAELLIHEAPIALKDSNAKGKIKYELVKPTYTIDRSSETTSLTFKVTIKDDDRVIVGTKDGLNDAGEYCVVLLNSAQKPINGISPSCGHSALEANKEFKYTGLTPDTVYNFRVYADIYTNNISETEKRKTEPADVLISTSTSYGVALGSVAAYATAKDGIILSFGSGVNITNIKKIDYTLMETIGGTTTNEIKSESNITPVFNVLNNNTVELNINPPDVKLVSGHSYYIVMSFYVESGGKLVLLNNKNVEYSIKFK